MLKCSLVGFKRIIFRNSFQRAFRAILESRVGPGPKNPSRLIRSPANEAEVVKLKQTQSFRQNLRVEGFRVRGLGFRVQGLGFRV